eukprot:TRINITY_DN989_c4_g1_i3.p1 TRINITY_DN989_c4_g1~~TRINITY_DN989_c4_g1_i3.p1  ORF type:complete len:218 (-),score=-13.29 TRINITY_DN989_c4_g1_i3:291-944(-)
MCCANFCVDCVKAQRIQIITRKYFYYIVLLTDYFLQHLSFTFTKDISYSSLTHFVITQMHHNVSIREKCCYYQRLQSFSIFRAWNNILFHAVICNIIRNIQSMLVLYQNNIKNLYNHQIFYQIILRFHIILTVNFLYQLLNGWILYNIVSSQSQDRLNALVFPQLYNREEQYSNREYKQQPLQFAYHFLYITLLYGLVLPCWDGVYLSAYKQQPKYN